MSQIVRNLSEIARCGIQYRSDCLSEMGVKSCHISYLVQICENPGISQDQLSRLICINKSNVARQVAYLEKEGYITRKTCPCDKRITELYPTAKSTEILGSMYSIMHNWEARLTQDMVPDEKENLTCLLKKMHPHAVSYMAER